ncbi:MAG: hypothetical protein ABC579_04230 [Candidatus Methanosuratincola petrocarbonis]
MSRKMYRFMRYWSDPFYDLHMDLNGIDAMDIMAVDSFEKPRRKAKR